MKFRNSLTIAIAVAVGIGASATNFGYSDGTVTRSTVFRVGTSELQGQAIKLTGDKVKMLKGCTISGIQASFGSSRTTGGTCDIFLSTELDGAPLASATLKVSGAVKWIDLAFDTPYVITGEEPALYLGYKANIAKTANLLMADFGNGFDGLSWAYGDGKWNDMNVLARGNASIRAIVDDAPAVTDMMIKPVKVEGYFKVGDGASLGATLFNFGSEPVTSFDVEVAVGKQAPVVTSYTGVNIAQGQNFEVEFPEFDINKSDLYDLTLSVTNVNGNKDMDLSDNSFGGEIFFYPADMERMILLEGFTGQACLNCPSGHTAINNFMVGVTETEIIEVMHHAGYSPDIMTMDADLDYTYFYGSPSTYAPAVMLNRTQIGSVSNVPVMNTSASNLSKGYAEVMSQQPYVSLSLSADYDPATRKVNLTLGALNHNDLPDGINAINVMLVQDHIIAEQSPSGSGYDHVGVFRGCLTGNSWGIAIEGVNNKRGASYEWKHEFTLPTEIYSDFWTSSDASAVDVAEHTLPVVDGNMRIVAYVAAHGSTPNTRNVFNAIETKLGESAAHKGYSGIEQVTVATPGLGISVVDGRVVVDGDCDSLSVYRIDGKQVNSSERLASGLYIVRAIAAGNVAVKKIFVK